MKEKMLEKVLKAHKNLIIEGDVESGKTTNILFPIIDKVIDKKESLFILDSKEEYVNKYCDKLKKNNYNIIILNLRDLDESEGWNPLEYPYNLYKKGDKDKAQEYLEKIGKILFYESPNEDPFWSTTASDFFTGLALALFEDGKEDEINLNSINNMFNGIDKRLGPSNYLTEYFKAKGTTSKPYIYASATLLAPKETRGSILSIVRQKLRLYVSREKLSLLMNKTTFNVEDIINKPSAIIVIGRDENRTLNVIATMFIEQLYAILVDLKVENKFNFVLDNFDIIEKCNDLVDILESCVSRNIKTYIATHSVEELANIYGSYMPKLCDLLVVGNDNIKLVLNNNEEIVRKEFKKEVIRKSDFPCPILSARSINLFDLEKKVLDIKTKQLENKEFTNSFENPFAIDEIIKNIDEKIEQLELAALKEGLKSEKEEETEK